MGVYQFEGLGIPVNDHEENYLQTDIRKITMSHAIEGAGGEAIRWALAQALKYEGSPVAEEWQMILKQYRALAGRQYPGVFRVKISIAVEEASEPETEAFWQKQRIQEPAPPGTWTA